MRLAAIVMQKDESEILPVWLRYYASLCGGYEHLYVFDDDSTDTETLELLGLAEKEGVNIEVSRGRWSHPEKGLLFSELIHRLGAAYDWYLPIDCDELVCAIVEGLPTISRAKIIQEIERAAIGGGSVFRIDTAFFNIPHTTTVYEQETKKVAVRATDEPIDIDAGLHMYDWWALRDTVPPDKIGPSMLGHIHFHNRPYPLALKMAREKLKFCVPDFKPETISAHTGAMFHLKWLFEIDERDYPNCFNPPNRIDISREFASLGLEIPYSGPPRLMTAAEKQALTDPVNTWRNGYPRVQT